MLLVIGYFVYANLDSASLSAFKPPVSVSDFVSLVWLWDMQQELWMLGLSCGLFIGARTYNNYLDR